MYTCYQVVLIAEDGDYVQADFQTEQGAYNHIIQMKLNGEIEEDGSQELIIQPLYRSF